MKKRQLNIFIDESGDLGEYNDVTEFYVISFVFHEQENDISGQIEKLSHSMKQYSNEPFAIHTEPLIRREEMYEEMLPVDRRNIFTRLFFFTIATNIQFKTFVFSKKHFKSSKVLLEHISHDIFEYFFSLKEYFDKYNDFIVYYDNGQLPIKQIVQTIFSLLFHSFEMRKVLPVDYKLLQTADMLCTMYLMNAKFIKHPMSHSEMIIFNSKYKFYHDYFVPISKKELK